MSIVEVNHTLTFDERHTLLFLTGGMKIINTRDISPDEAWNLREFFGYNKSNTTLLKVIIFRDKVVTKIVV